MNCSCLKYILKPFICAGPSPTTKLNGFHLTYTDDAILTCVICKFIFFYFFVVKEHDIFTYYMSTTSYLVPFSKGCKRVASLSNDNVAILAAMNNNRKFFCLFLVVVVVVFFFVFLHFCRVKLLSQTA